MSTKMRYDRQEWSDYVGEGFLLEGSSTAKPHCVHIYRWSSELEEVLANTGVTGAVIGNWEDPTHDLGFLSKFVDKIEYLQFKGDAALDRAIVSTLVNLETLFIEHSVEGIDFSQLVRLRRCVISDARDIGNVAACPVLEELRVSPAPKVDTLATFVPLQKLTLLLLDAAPLLSLRHIEQLPALRELHLMRCRRLESLDGIENTQLVKLGLYRLSRLRTLAPLTQCATLRELELDACKQIEDMERLGRRSGLEILTIRSGRPIPSLAFLRHLEHLRYFGSFVTKIVDGNLGLLLELPALEQVAIHPPMRHYSHTDQQLNESLQARSHGD